MEFNQTIRDAFDAKRSVWFLVMLVLAIIIDYPFFIQGQIGGIIGFALIIIFMFVFILITLFKEEDKIEFEHPIAGSLLEVGTGMMIAIILVLFLTVIFLTLNSFVSIHSIFGVDNLKESASVFNPSLVKFSADGTPLTRYAQSISQVKFDINPWNSFALTVITFPIKEEFGFAYILPLIGMVILVPLFSLAFSRIGQTSGISEFLDNQWVNFILGGLLFPAFMFAISHFTNNTFFDPTTQKFIMGPFIFAIIFRIAMNFGAYVLNVVLSFLFTLHFLNNWIAYGFMEGLKILFNEIFKGNLFAIAFTVLMLLPIIHFLINIKKVPDLLSDWAEGIGL